jgi:cell division protein FtsB
MLAVLRESLEQQLLDVQAQIEALNAEITASSSYPGVSSMELDTGEARQKVVLKSVESLNRTLRSLRATENWLIRRLNGSGIVSVHNRRKS